MPVRKQTYMPEIRDVAATQQTKDHKGRHRLLENGSIYYAMYLHIKLHPDCTRADVVKATGGHHQRITTLLDEGLIYENGKLPGGHAKLRVLEGGDTGRGRDVLVVELNTYVNAYGEYSVDSRLVGELPTAREDHPRLVKTQEVMVRIPRPREGYDVRAEAHKPGAKIIEGELVK